MSRTKPPPPAPPLPRASTGAKVLAGGAALVLLADLPGLFTRGDLLRGALLPLFAAATLWAGLARGGLLAGTDRRLWLLVALPSLLVLPGLFAIARPSLATPAALARSLAPWLALSALALGARGILRRERDALLLWTWLIVAGALAGAWLYVEWLIVGAAAGPFGRPGVAGPLLGALLGPALLLPWTSRPLLRALALALLAAGCAFSASRTGWAVGGFALLLALALAPERRFPRGLRRGSGLTALVGGAIAVLLLTGVVPGGGTTLDVRRGVWRAAGTLVAERPLTGHGLGSFRAEVLRVRDVEEARLSRGREPFMAHNDVLHVAAEGGLGAGLLLVFFGAGALACAWRAWRARGRDPLAGAALCVLAAQAAASMAEQVLPDPAQVLLTALALATALARRAPSSEDLGATPSRPLRLAFGVVATLLLAATALRARDVLADTHLRAFRDAQARGLTLEDLESQTRTRLLEGALRWRPDHPEARYIHGVSEAEQGRYGTAREAWRRALEVEPALTEARLDMAQSYALEDRRDDALAALIEARRFDPTRYDLVLRQGHVALGEEPVPGGPASGTQGPGFEPLEPLRRYNEAALLAPGRFETEVAFARVARRLGDGDSAGIHLRKAESLAPGAGEILFESFHLAEVEGRADERQLASILAFALAAEVGLAGTIRREALACEEAALERSSEARARQPPSTTRTGRASTGRGRRSRSAPWRCWRQASWSPTRWCARPAPAARPTITAPRSRASARSSPGPETRRPPTPPDAAPSSNAAATS